MPKKIVPIERSQEGGLPGETVERHPSFGLVGLFKTCGSQPLFGSPLEVNNGYVSLKISHGEKIHSGHGYDRYFPRSTVVEVMISEAQFAQLITSWNSGEGVPCTFDFIAPGGEGSVPGWPDDDYVSDTEQVRNEFKDRISDVKKKVEAAISSMNVLLEKKGALTIAEKGSIREGMIALSRLLDDSAPYMAAQFVEVTEKVIQKAMTEIDAFVTKVAVHTGLESLKKMEVSGLKAAENLLDKHVDKVTSADPYLEGIMNRSENDDA